MAISELPSIPEYGIWQAMKRRCDTPSVNRYERYGGRGICVCDRWLNDFWTFYHDMGPRPSSDYSLERINNDGDYEPGNCVWATRKEQANNRSSNHLVEYEGEMLTISQLSDKTNIKQGTLWYRINAGYTGQELVKEVGKKYELNGVSKTLSDWEKETGILESALRKRIFNLGWPIEKALTTPSRKLI